LKLSLYDHEISQLLPSFQAAGALFAALKKYTELYGVGIADRDLLNDIEKLCQRKKKEIRGLSRKILHNFKRMRCKFPGLRSLTENNEDLLKEFA